jgi:hypothetical protein
MDFAAKTIGPEETISSQGILKKQMSEINLNNVNINSRLDNIINSLKAIYRSESLYSEEEVSPAIQEESLSDALYTTIYSQRSISEKLTRIESFLRETIQ